MRTCSVELEADIAEECTTLAHLLRITRTDGTIVRLTDANDDLVVGGQTYFADPSFTTSAVFTSASMSTSQNVTLTMPMTTGAVEEADVRAKRFAAAQAEIFIVNYANTTHGVMALFNGTFGSIKLCDKHCISVEIVPAGSALGAKAFGGEVYQSTCRNSLGDGDCQVDLTAARVAFTVDTVDGAVFTASELTANDDEHFTQGFIEWLTGDNEGLKSMVAQSVQATGTVKLVAATANPIKVGDTGYAYPGCDKLPQTCFEKFDNIVNFDGEPHVPSSDIIQASPVGYLRPALRG